MGTVVIHPFEEKEYLIFFHNNIHSCIIMWNKTFMVIVIALAPIIFADPPLVGRWIEDETLRTGLYDFLWARGVNWFERQYAAKLTTWQYEQTIVKIGNDYKVSGIKGPLREVFSYKLFTDNSTTTNIDLGKLGGERWTTAEIKENSLISYLYNPITNTTDMLAIRTISPSNPDIMYFKTKDIPYGYEMVATMKRQ